MIDAAVTGENGAEALGNTYKTARLIGQSIVSRKAEYMKAISKALSECSAGEVEIKDVERVTARFEPGLIIDFPYVRILTDKWQLSSRTCLTVCAGGSQSKIWTRIVRELSKKDVVIGADEVAELNMISSKCATVVNNIVRELYQRDFSSTLNKRVTLNEVGTIEIFGVDCVGREISSAIKRSIANLSWDHSSRSIENHELSEALRRVTKISMAHVGQDVTTNAEFSLHDGADFVPYRSTREANSIFVAATSGRKAFLSGLVDAGPDMKSVKFDEVSHLPASSGATAELATKIGAAY